MRIMERTAKKDRPLTLKMEAFALAVAETGNQAEAYRRVYAGINTLDSTAYAESARLMADPRISERVAQLQRERAIESRMTLQKVLEHYADLALADPNEFAEYRRLSCRFCHGNDHLYQWIDANEWAERAAEAIALGKNPPSEAGGYGFNPKAEPSEYCPRCFGEGIEDVYFADTRKIKGPSRRLFAGIKTSKDGVEFKFRSQDKALEALARIHGLLQPKEPDGAREPIKVQGGMPDLFAAEDGDAEAE